MKESIEQLACEYVIARLARRKSKKQIHSWFREMWRQDESYPCEYGDGCWKDRALPQSKWCGLCNEHHALRNLHAQNMKQYRRALGRLERAAMKVIIKDELGQYEDNGNIN